VLRCTLDYPSGLPGRSGRCRIFVQDWPDFVEDYQAGKVKKRKAPTGRIVNGRPAVFLRQSREADSGRGKAGCMTALAEADLAWQVPRVGTLGFGNAPGRIWRRAIPCRTASRTVAYCGRARRAIRETPGASRY